MNKKINNKYNYIWDYLIPENNDRGEKLTHIIEPYLKKNETVLDLVCGFSPLTTLLTKKYKCRVIGFDINKKTIDYCRKKYDKKLTSFIVATDENFQTDENIQVHMHLGISPSNNPLEPKDDAGSSTKIILQKRPRLIIIEAATYYSEQGMDKLASNIASLGIYQLVITSNYKISFNSKSVNLHFKTALQRKVAIFVKKEDVELCSLSDSNLINLLYKTFPSSQAESIPDLNIGFGYLYYSLARILRPKNVLAMGSAKGFSPICLALGIKDNHNNGKLHFVDAGYSDTEDGLSKGMGGVGFWKQKDKVAKQFKQFGVDRIITPYIMTTAEYYGLYKKNGFPLIDLLYIDADHSYDGFKHDFEYFSKVISPTGIIIFHDALAEKGINGFDFGIKDYYENNLIKNNEFSVFRIPVWPGLGLAQRINNNSIMLEATRLARLNLTIKNIESAKAFQLWQKYCVIRDNLLKRIRRLDNPNNDRLPKISLGENPESAEEILRKIQGSKFYKFWQKYCSIRDTLLLQKR